MERSRDDSTAKRHATMPNSRLPELCLVHMNIDEKIHNDKITFVKSVINLLESTNENWSSSILESSERDCNFKSGYSLLLFPDSVSNVFDFTEDFLDQEMVKYLQSSECGTLNIRAKIAFAINVRMMLLVNQCVYQKSFTYIMNPKNVELLSRSIWRTCSKIWYFAGDKSVDFNYYSKRSLLFYVYISAMKHYVNDDSLGYRETLEYISNLLDQIVKTMGFIKSLASIKMEDIPILRLFS